MAGEYKFGHADTRVTPAYLRSIGEPDTAAVLTTGAIGKLAAASAEARAATAKFAGDIAKHADDLAAIAKRLERLERQSADAPRAIVR
jgi:threonine dehydrogenase-like Zn-dependent dehydrogenase